MRSDIKKKSPAALFCMYFRYKTNLSIKKIAAKRRKFWGTKIPYISESKKITLDWCHPCCDNRHTYCGIRFLSSKESPVISIAPKRGNHRDWRPLAIFDILELNQGNNFRNCGFGTYVAEFSAIGCRNCGNPVLRLFTVSSERYCS